VSQGSADVCRVNMEADHYRYVCEELNKKFPSLKTACITLRGSLSASHNTCSGVLWKDGAFYSAPVYNIIPIIARVVVDSFMGGLIYGLRKYQDDPQKALNFAAAFGMGSKLITKQAVGDKDYDGIAKKASDCVG